MTKRPSLSTALSYRDPEAALKFLEAAFGFAPAMIIRHDGKIVHSEMTLGDGLIMVGSEWDDAHKSPASLDAKNTQSVHVHLTEDVDAPLRPRPGRRRRRRTGADRPILRGTDRARDPEGHIWTFGQTVKAMKAAEWDKLGGVTSGAPGLRILNPLQSRKPCFRHAARRTKAPLSADGSIMRPTRLAPILLAIGVMACDWGHPSSSSAAPNDGQYQLAQAGPVARVAPSTKQEMQLSFAGVSKKASPAVVNVYAQRVVRGVAVDPFWRQFGINMGVPQETRAAIARLGSAGARRWRDRHQSPRRRKRRGDESRAGRSARVRRQIVARRSARRSRRAAHRHEGRKTADARVRRYAFARCRRSRHRHRQSVRPVAGL